MKVWCSASRRRRSIKAATATGTRLTVSDALYGRVSDEQVSSLKSGWQRLFTHGLKRFPEAA